MLDRRRFLKALAAVGLVHQVPACAQPGVANFVTDPFSLGIASGYPTPRGVTLWTRLVLHAQGEPQPGAVPVRWEVSEDEHFRHIVARGSELAEARFAHSVHVDVAGLRPGRWYTYRFMSGNAESAHGRFRTAPEADSLPEQLRFAVASCQQYEQGYYGAYKHIVQDTPDLVLFLGDYIYESSWGRNHVRKHGAGETFSLDAYRRRHALYKSDPDLQSAHAACAWLLTWDDHEVANDYAADRPQHGGSPEAFLARRAAAYRAYYEHMPLPARMRPVAARMRLHTETGWGRLASFFLLDDRQYRSHQSCAPQQRGGGSTVVELAACPELAEPGRSMLGEKQEQWLAHVLSGSRALWTLIGQQTLIAPFADRRQGRNAVWTDGWDGYPGARRRLVGQLQRAPNPVTFGGDMHSFHVADLNTEPGNPATPVAASEFVATSITSQPRSQPLLDALARENPHMKLAEGRYRGYLRVRLRTQALEVDLCAMETVLTPEARCFTLAAFAVESGEPGAQRR